MSGGEHESSIELYNCEIVGNELFGGCFGAGFDLFAAEARVENCLIAGNRTEEEGYPNYGGGISLRHCWECDQEIPSKATIVNSTIVENRASGGGGGVSLTGNNILAIENSILWDNSDPEIYNQNVAPDVGVTYSDIQMTDGRESWPGEGNIGGDPLFSGDGHYYLGEGSPCIDAGNPDSKFNDLCFPPSMSTVLNDMGAYGGRGTCYWCWDHDGEHYGDHDGDLHMADLCGGSDCDDLDPNTYHGAEEICDGSDNDCDGDVAPDEVDADSDGWMACEGDCDDTDPEVHPGTVEICENGSDDDCDESIDMADADCTCSPETGSPIGCEDLFPVSGDTTGAVSMLPSYRGCVDWDESGPEEIYALELDFDGGIIAAISGLATDLDVFILAGGGEQACNAHCIGYGDTTALSMNPDTGGSVYPPGTYYIVVDGSEGVEGSYDLEVSCCNDGDGDGFADSSCGGLDCDDEDPDINPQATELCDGINNTCDCGVRYDETDYDGDGYVECYPWEGAIPGILGGGDCDDRDPDSYPGAPERCDGVDNDCGHDMSDDEVDDDNDGYVECSPWEGEIPGVLDGEDCNDMDAAVNPGMQGQDCLETPDGVDDDCDGQVDEDTCEECFLESIL